MTPEELKDRTFKFSLSILAVFKLLKSSEEGRIIGRQLLRSSSSVAANYRAACRARSKPEFYAKINIVLEEADKSFFGWNTSARVRFCTKHYYHLIFLKAWSWSKSFPPREAR